MVQSDTDLLEYVKVCSLYGAGFDYIPGTDICMKIGGYVRYQVNTGSGNSVTGGPFFAAPGGYNNRAGASDVLQRARAIATFDTRQQTAYGTLRTYLLIGYSQETSSATTTSPAVYNTRAFIQIAGFTFGKATSFFDFISSAAVAINAGFTNSPDTGDGGHIVGGYTAQFGNGVSGTVAIEQSRRLGTVYGSASFVGQPGLATIAGIGDGAYTFAASPLSNNLGEPTVTANNGADSRPDFVANLRIDQAWGSAQIAGAVHDVSASYYGLPNGTGNAPVFTSNNGHPDDKWGWAVSPGLRLNAPMIGPGDYFQASATYAVCKSATN